MPTLTKFYSFVEAVHEKKHNLGSDTLKVLLTNTAPSLSNTVKADISGELSTGSGYTAGGETITITSSAQSSGLYTLIASDVPWTASGGSIGPFRYAVIYNDTATNDELIGYIDYGYSITVASGQTFTIDFDQTSGLYYAS
jgi:hypothetical protein